jgi:hypothetical protein
LRGDDRGAANSGIRVSQARLGRARLAQVELGAGQGSGLAGNLVDPVESDYCSAVRTLSPDELKEWCVARGIELNDQGTPTHPYAGSYAFQCEVPKDLSRLIWFCRFIELALQPRDHCLLWVSAWGVWPSSENWHLYYRLRGSYGDQRLIHEGPGHLFQQYENADLVTFLEVGFVSGWDMHLVPTAGYGRVFVSHDEWVEFAMDDKSKAQEVAAELAKAGLASQPIE